MTLAFAVFLTEAVLMFSAPFPGLFFARRSRRYVVIAKCLHVFFQVLTLVCIVLGLTAAVKRKSESPRPREFPNFTLFSSSLLGRTIAALLVGPASLFGLRREDNAVWASPSFVQVT